MPRGVWIWCLAVVLPLFAVGPCRAGLVVSIVSTTVPQGGTGSVVVDITNNGTSSVQINDYAIQLVIAPTNGTLTQLAFSSPTDQQLGYLSGSNYIFQNNSFAASPPPFVGSPANQPTVFPNDTFNATDSTFDGSTVTIAPSQTYLLAMLPITTLTQLDAQAGDTFMVSLAPGSGNGSSIGGSATYFNVLDLNPSSPTYFEELSAVPYTSTSGMVTILPASVPEPASIVCGLTAVLILAALGGVRRACRLVLPASMFVRC